MVKLNSHQLRDLTDTTLIDSKKIKRNPIYLVCDRVLDTYNIGSLFRLADAIAAEKIYLCGDMEYPPSSRIHKSAVGTEVWVPWEKKEKVIEIGYGVKIHGVKQVLLTAKKLKNFTAGMVISEDAELKRAGEMIIKVPLKFWLMI